MDKHLAPSGGRGRSKHLRFSVQAQGLKFFFNKAGGGPLTLASRCTGADIPGKMACRPGYTLVPLPGPGALTSAYGVVQDMSTTVQVISNLCAQQGAPAQKGYERSISR